MVLLKLFKRRKKNVFNTLLGVVNVLFILKSIRFPVEIYKFYSKLLKPVRQVSNTVFSEREFRRLQIKVKEIQNVSYALHFEYIFNSGQEIAFYNNTINLATRNSIKTFSR